MTEETEYLHGQGPLTEITDAITDSTLPLMGLNNEKTLINILDKIASFRTFERLSRVSRFQVAAVTTQKDAKTAELEAKLHDERLFMRSAHEIVSDKHQYIADPSEAAVVFTAYCKAYGILASYILAVSSDLVSGKGSGKLDYWAFSRVPVDGKPRIINPSAAKQLKDKASLGLIVQDDFKADNKLFLPYAEGRDPHDMKIIGTDMPVSVTSMQGFKLMLPDIIQYLSENQGNHQEDK
ncbi:hypothetical protein ACFLZ6_01430 [Nanoarchaeota archaeon]